MKQGVGRPPNYLRFDLPVGDGVQSDVALAPRDAVATALVVDRRSRAHLDGLRPDLLQPHGPKAPGGECLKERRILQELTRACTWTDGVSSREEYEEQADDERRHN